MPEPEPLLNLRGDLTGFALFLRAGYLRVLLKVVLTSHIQVACLLTNCNGSRSFPPRFSHYFLASFAVWLWASAVSRRDQAAGEFGAPFGRSSRLNAQGLRSETSP